MKIVNDTIVGENATVRHERAHNLSSITLDAEEYIVIIAIIIIIQLIYSAQTKTRTVWNGVHLEKPLHVQSIKKLILPFHQQFQFSLSSAR
jgi:hypothetical protein